LTLDDVGLGKQTLLYAPLCTIIQEILEVVYRTYRTETTVLGRPFFIKLKKTFINVDDKCSA